MSDSDESEEGLTNEEVVEKTGFPFRSKSIALLDVVP